jgi:hypothetical protein
MGVMSWFANKFRGVTPPIVDYGSLADESDAHAASFGIDPPGPGRKSYAERYRETSAMSTEEIKELIQERKRAGQECGVLYRVLAERPGDE